MANIKSAAKRARQADKKRLHNQSLRSKTVTLIKKAKKAIESCETQKKEELLKAATETVRAAMRQIDKMVPKKLYHKNKAARLKSRLNARLKKAAQ